MTYGVDDAGHAADLSGAVARDLSHRRSRSNSPDLVRGLLVAAVSIFSFHLWRIGDVNITFCDLLFVVVVFLEASRSRLNAMPFGALTPVWLASLGTMLVGLFLGSLFNGDLTRWLIIAAQYLFSFVMLPMLLIRDRKTLEVLILTLVIAMTAMESVGILTYYMFEGFKQANAIFGPDFITGSRRLGAMAGDANWNGAIIAMTLPFVIYAGRRRLISFWAAAICGLILLWALMLAASFTGFCAAVFACGIIAIVGRIPPSPKLLLLVALLGGGLAVSGYEMPAIFAKRVAPAIQTGNLDDAGTYGDRAALIAEAWDHAEQTAIIGMGADQYRTFSAFSQPVHNMFMLLLAEGGILGLFGWLGIVVLLVAIPLAQVRRHRLEGALSLAVIFVFLTFSMASPHMYARMWMVPVMMSLGVILTARRDLSPLGRPNSRNLTAGLGQRY